MSRRVAFLRAINVGGRTVRMDHLRSIFEKLAFSGVDAFIARGNVIFETRLDDDGALDERSSVRQRRCAA